LEKIQDKFEPISDEEDVIINWSLICFSN